MNESYLETYRIEQTRTKQVPSISFFCVATQG